MMKNLTGKTVFSAVAAIPAACLILSAPLQAHASVKKGGAYHVYTLGAAPAGPAYGTMTDAEFEAEKKAAAERSHRSIASVDSIDENSALSDDLKNLRNELIGGPKYENGKVAGNWPGIRDVGALDAYLEKLDQDSYYGSHAPDAQFAAAQMAPLRAFKGFFNRAMNFFQGAKVTHSMTVTSLRVLASSILVYSPTDQWKTGMQYLTMPQPGMGKDIDDEQSVQAFVEAELIPTLIRSANRISHLNFSGKSIYVDNKIMYGTAKFAQEQDRFTIIGEAERHTLLAAMDFNLAALMSFEAYNMNGARDVMQELAGMYGLDSFRFNPEGSSAKQRFAIYKRAHDTRGFLQINENGATWMKNAFVYYVAAARHQKVAWIQLKKDSKKEYDPTQINPLFSAQAFMPFQRIFDASLDNIEYMLKNSKGDKACKGTWVQSAMTSENVCVDLPAFFSNPPENLIAFAPTGFDGSKYRERLNGREWHNFSSGRPTSWDVGAFQKYFPSVKSSDDVPAAARILSQVWGGWILGIPMASVVL